MALNISPGVSLTMSDVYPPVPVIQLNVEHYGPEYQPRGQPNHVWCVPTCPSYTAECLAL